MTKSMKVQLFVPPQGYIAQRWEEGGTMPPLGILFLAAVLEEEGIEVDVVPADILGFGWREIEKRIKDFRPDIVGGTTTTENRFDSFKLAHVVKKLDPGIVTVLGGPHISMAKEDTIRNVPDVDVVVIGEGERTLAELARAVEAGSGLGNVKGIIFRNEGRPVYTGFRERIEDLDTLPLPGRHLAPMDRYRFFIRMPDGRKLRAQNIMTSRGCPFECYFCATPVNWGRKVRGHSTERVLKEIEILIERYGAEFIWFYDDTFNYNNKRLHEIMDMIIERRLDIKFGCEFRIDLVDRPLLEKMVKAGLAWGHFGVEAGSERVRRDIVRKKFEMDNAYRFIAWAGELGFTPNAFLIYSHDTETWAEANETLAIIEKMKEINPETQVATAVLHVYPGTPLEHIAKERGVLPTDFSWAKKKDMKKVVVLPAAQGNVPLYKHKLTWHQIAELVMKGGAEERRVLSWSKIKSVLRSIKSVKVFWIYSVFILVMIKHKLKNILTRRNPTTPPPQIRID